MAEVTPKGAAPIGGTIKLVSVATCRECGELKPVGRRTLDSSAEHHTQTTGHFTVVVTRPA